MIYIKDFETKGINCLEACHLLLCNFYRREYEAVFYNIFDFCFNRESFAQSGELGSCLRWPFSIVNNMAEIYNLCVQGKFHLKTEALRIIEPLLKCGTPVIIESTTAYCPWLKQHKGIDNPRYLLVFDSGDSWLDVIDTTLEQQRVKRLLFRDMPPESLGLGIAELSPYTQDYQKLCNMMVMHLKSLNIQECFEDCSDVLQKLNNVNREFSTTGFYEWATNADIFFGQRLPNSTRYFAEFLKYIEKKLYRCEMFINEYPVLEQIYHDWVMFRNLLYKSKLYGSLKQTEKDKLCLLLEKICRQYQHIIDSVLRKCK